MFGSGTQVTGGTGASNEPWADAKVHINSAMDKAQNLLDSGAGFNPYPNSTVIPYADETLQGMQGIKDYADQFGGAMQQPLQQQIDVMNQGGYNPYQQTAMNRTDALASGTGYNQELTGAAQSLGNLNNQMRDNGGLTTYQQDAIDQNAALASGSQIFGQNPGFQRVLENAQKAMTDSSNTAAAKVGRYGSGAHQGTLADSIGDVTGQLYSDEYGRQLGRMDNARAQMFGQSQQGVGNIANAAKDLASIGQTGYGNVQDANRDLLDGGQMGLDNMQRAAGNIGNAYEIGKQPYSDYMQIGGMNEDLATRTMQDNLRRYDASNNAQWDRLSAANAIFQGAGALGGSKTTTTTAPTKSPFGSAIANAANAFGQNQDWGSAIGSGLSSLVGGILG